MPFTPVLPKNLASCACKASTAFWVSAAGCSSKPAAQSADRSRYISSSLSVAVVMSKGRPSTCVIASSSFYSLLLFLSNLVIVCIAATLIRHLCAFIRYSYLLRCFLWSATCAKVSLVRALAYAQNSHSPPIMLSPTSGISPSMHNFMLYKVCSTQASEPV